MKTIYKLAAAITLTTAIAVFSGCGGSSSDGTIDKSHMFGTFSGTFVRYPEGTTDYVYEDQSATIGDNSEKITDLNYIYIPTDSNDFTDYSEVEINGEQTTLNYTATSTDNTITWHRTLSHNGVVYHNLQGTVTFNNDFISGSVTGTRQFSEDGTVFRFQCDELIKQQ